MDEIYLSRTLSLLDRNPLSPYYGCFDRNYWHYKMAADFPSSIYQMGVLSLALFYKADRDPRLFEFIKAGAGFWVSLQHKDGSFDEWFPNEHSVVATAFTCWGMVKALEFLSDSQREQVISIVRPALERAVVFLDKNIDFLVSNHTAGAIAALYEIYRITKDAKILDSIARNKKAILAGQHGEGWYDEYGAPDIGYQTVNIFFLAQYWLKSRDEEILRSLEKACNFLVYFVNPDGTIGGNCFSRNTKYIFRYGLALLSDTVPAAAYLLNAVEKTQMVNIDCADDRYFIFFFLPEFLLSINEKRPDSAIVRKDFMEFPGCGLVVKATDRYRVVINCFKGGAMEVFDKTKKRLVFSSLGYAYQRGKSVICSSAGFTPAIYSIAHNADNIVIKVNAGFVFYDLSNHPAKIFLLFRLLNVTLWRIPIVRTFLDKYIKVSKVKNAKTSQDHLARTITLKADGITIKDDLDLKGGVYDLYEVCDLSFRFSPTSKYSKPVNSSFASLRKVDRNPVVTDLQF